MVLLSHSLGAECRAGLSERCGPGCQCAGADPAAQSSHGGQCRHNLGFVSEGTVARLRCHRTYRTCRRCFSARLERWMAMQLMGLRLGCASFFGMNCTWRASVKVSEHLDCTCRHAAHCRSTKGSLSLLFLVS